MESTIETRNENTSTEAVQSEMQPRVRQDAALNEQVAINLPRGVDAAALQRYADELATAPEREKRIAQETGNTIHRGYTGANARNAQSAEIFAQFDPSDTRVQPCEFYEYIDPVFARDGRF